MKVAICDASQEGMKIWQESLQQINKSQGLIWELFCYTSGEELLFHVEDKCKLPDLLLLDTQLPGVSGMEVARRIRQVQERTEIIFLTADEQKWSEAFDLGARHYLVKEKTKREKLEQVVFQAIKHIRAEGEKYFFFSSAGVELAVPVDHIWFFSVADHLTTVHYKDSEAMWQKFQFYTAISKLESRVFNKGFVRIHKSYLVALKTLKFLTTYRGAVLKDGTILPVGRHYYMEAKTLFEEHCQRLEQMSRG